MKRAIFLFGVLVGVGGLTFSALAGPAPAGPPATEGVPGISYGGIDGVWSDGFDTYALGSGIIGQGGWQGWYLDPAADALVSNAQAHSAPHSLEIVNTSDVVQEFSLNSGQWSMTAMHYLPSPLADNTYFIMNNEYNAVGQTAQWTIELNFDPTTNTVGDDFATTAGRAGFPHNPQPIAYNRWAEIRVDFDLDTDYVEMYYEGALISSGQWATRGGAVALAAIDLFSNGPLAYYDSLSLVPEPASLVLLAAGACVAIRRRRG